MLPSYPLSFLFPAINTSYSTIEYSVICNIIILTICDKTWKIIGQTCWKYVKFASKYWAKKGFQLKYSTTSLTKLFFINTTTDDEYIHPTQICQKCYLHATVAIKRNTTTSINRFNNWNAYFDDNCQICDTVKMLSKGVIDLQKIHPNIRIADLMNTQTLICHCVNVDFVQMFSEDLLQ